MLTEETTAAVLIIESINKAQALRAERAMEEMKERMDSYFKTKSTAKILTKADPSFDYN